MQDRTTPPVEPPPTLEVPAESQGQPNGQNENQWSPLDRPDLVRVNKYTGLPEETCVIVVGGFEFEDWETVWIQWNWADNFSQFKFTCAEREPYPETAAILQFKPGDDVQIFLGGIRVVSGKIITRQIAADANNHGVMLQGVSHSWSAARASIIHKTSDFDGKSFLEIASELLAPTGVRFQVLGAIDQTPFKSGAKPNPGEPIAQFLDRLARDRKIIVSNTPAGDFLFIGEHSMPVAADLLEGENIKKIQCIISDQELRSEYLTRGQSMGSDEQNGRDASEMEARGPGRLGWYSPLLTTIEHPVFSLAEVVTRNATEQMWSERNEIECVVTTYGWFRPALSTVPAIAPRPGETKGHALWMAGDEVIVHSPMAMLRGMALKIQTVTWVQSRQSGSETILQLVPPWGLNGHGRFVGREGIPRPAPSQSDTTAPVTPPAAKH